MGIAALLVQGVATSIDALSVGFTIAEYSLPAALLAVLFFTELLPLLLPLLLLLLLLLRCLLCCSLPG